MKLKSMGKAYRDREPCKWFSQWRDLAPRNSHMVIINLAWPASTQLWADGLPKIFDSLYRSCP